MVVIENVLFAVTGAVGYGAPIEEVLAYYAANRDAVAIVSGLVALYLPLLLVFVTGLHGLVERRGGAGADWSRLALAAGATLSAIFVLVNVLQIGLALSAGGLAEPTPAFGGTSTRATLSFSATRAACNGAAPPNAISV